MPSAEGSSDADVRSFYAKLQFFKIYGVFTRIRGLRVGVIQCDEDRGSIFRDFVRTSIMDSPLK